jgi:hypothetical protein
VTLYRMFDASQPPGQPYPGSAAVAGYIGGNTPHVWTLAEWQRFHDLRQFPIWVGAGRTDGAADGQAAAAAAHALGWAPNRPDRRTIIVDVEALAMRAYLDAFSAPVWQAGYQTVVYESASAVRHNPPKEGIWVALWDDQADIPPGAAIIGHQYQPDVPFDGTQVDLSVIDDTFLVHGGQGPRK